jgi:hypothetical protein
LNNIKDHHGKTVVVGITYINNGEMPRPDYVRSTVSRISASATRNRTDSTRSGGSARTVQSVWQPEWVDHLNPKAETAGMLRPLAYIGEASLRERLDMMAQRLQGVKAIVPGVEFRAFSPPIPGPWHFHETNTTNYEKYLEELGRY